MSQIIEIALDAKLRRRLEAIGKAKSRTTAWLMKEAVRKYIEDEEAEEQAARESLERWARFEKTGARLEHAAVARWLGSWGTPNERPCPKPRRR